MARLELRRDEGAQAHRAAQPRPNGAARPQPVPPAQPACREQRALGGEVRVVGRQLERHREALEARARGGVARQEAVVVQRLGAAGRHVVDEELRAARHVSHAAEAQRAIRDLKLQLRVRRVVEQVTDGHHARGRARGRRRACACRLVCPRRHTHLRRRTYLRRLAAAHPAHARHDTARFEQAVRPP